MSAWVTKLVLFSLFSLLQVRYVDAKDYTIPTEEPQNCVESQRLPCAITTGDEPRMFHWSKSLFELDRNIVMDSSQKSKWHVYNGLLVLESQSNHSIVTPFAEVKIGKSKIMIHVMKNKMRVLCLDGEGVRIIPKGKTEESFLVPGFQNWYGGVDNGASESGVATVIDLQEYSKMRVPFFLNYSLGFQKELGVLASRVKWAAYQASLIHKELYDRKVASLESTHQQEVRKIKQGIEFNKSLRRLFLQKIRYDY